MVADIGVDPVPAPPGLSGSDHYVVRTEALESSAECPVRDLRPNPPVNLRGRRIGESVQVLQNQRLQTMGLHARKGRALESKIKAAALAAVR